MSENLKRVSVTILGIVIFLLIWEFSIKLGFIKPQYTSYPTEIINDLISFYQSGELMQNLFATVYEAFMGLLFGTIIGVIVALTLGSFKKIGNVFEPTLVVINSIPQIALAPIYIMWFGIGYGSKIFVASLLVFFLVFFSTYGGVKNSEKKLSESAALLGANERTILFQITIPTIMPWIISGVKAGIGASLVGAIVSEYLGAAKGIGWTISFATSYFDMARVMSCLVLLLILGYISNKILSFIEKKFMIYREGK